MLKILVLKMLEKTKKKKETNKKNQKIKTMHSNYLL